MSSIGKMLCIYLEIFIYLVCMCIYIHLYIKLMKKGFEFESKQGMCGGMKEKKIEKLFNYIKISKKKVFYIYSVF